MKYSVNVCVLFLYALVLGSCSKNLDQKPQATATNSAIFSSEQGLKLYSASFYDALPFTAANPSTGEAVRGDDQYAGADFGARNSAPTYLQDGAFNSRQATGWSTTNWTPLRNFNYFIANLGAPRTGITEPIRLNYLGIARCFRAWFYYSMVQKFGNVPWVGKPLEVSDSSLYATRNDRTLVMDSILADLNFAAANISATTDATSSQITKWVAYGLKSRICLFEGTFRKYQTNYNLASTANTWLQNAASAAKAVMDSSGLALSTAGGTSSAYRNLFISASPISSEVMLSVVMNQSLSVMNDANWYFTSATYGSRYSFTRDFINTYLTAAGTPFTDIPGHDTLPFAKETVGRDARLAQTIRTPGYTRISSNKTVAAPPVFSYTYTGYQPIKWCLDDVYYDAASNNTNSLSLMRYAEILLNYAEAARELGTLTAGDWTKTVGAIRARAGLTGGLTLPTTVDPYIQSYYSPVASEDYGAGLTISDPVLLEIRRERGIELCLEGFRFADLTRWRLGTLLQRSWNGMYVPALNQLMDLNGDGVMDVCFYQGTQPSNVSGVTYINVSPTLNGTTNPMLLSNGTYGEIHWLDNVKRTWHDYKYLYPIPYSEILLNSNLGQNPKWQ
ncbi:MAG: RagB/SusD family nutrient uptake outer membrane protein [Bacteroidetes bacterium]|nr:RagB/SusD family nutrient uptake outer membrane protein [Bacteroidota bacterium]